MEKQSLDRVHDPLYNRNKYIRYDYIIIWLKEKNRYA